MAFESMVEASNTFTTAKVSAGSGAFGFKISGDEIDSKDAKITGRERHLTTTQKSGLKA